MKKITVFVLLLLNLSVEAQTDIAQLIDAKKHNPVQIMFIGSDHWNSPGQDVVNIKPLDVLEPKRQKELEMISNELLSFSPTVIAVEAQSQPPLYQLKSYQSFSFEDLKNKKNESIQLGFRLAKMAGLDRVHGIDEQPSDGEPSYFPRNKVMAHIKKTGQENSYQVFFKQMMSGIMDFVKNNSQNNLADYLYHINEEGNSIIRPDSYLLQLEFDQGEDQPGAELYAYYMMRNAKIFAKLMDVTQPGDKVIVIYGAGHSYWLKHLIEMTPGYEFISPNPYFKQASEKIIKSQI